MCRIVDVQATGLALQRRLRPHGRLALAKRTLRDLQRLGLVEVRRRPDGDIGYYLTPLGETVRLAESETKPPTRPPEDAR